MTTETTTARNKALRLMRAGEATISEVAHLAGVDRQLAYYWAKVAGIDVAAAREARIKQLWHAARRGKSTDRR